MSMSEYDKLAEFLGTEPCTASERYLFESVWEYMSEEYKAQVREIEL